MELKDLLKMTVPKLREEAMKIPSVQGAHGMQKEELIRVIAEAHGIALKRSVAKPSTIAEIKLQIRKLRVERDALRGPDKALARHRVRRQIKLLKRRTRQLARAAAEAAAPESKPSEESPSPAAAE